MRNFFPWCCAAVFATTPVAADEKVYQKVIPSAVFLVTQDGLGSGSLVDADRRLVVTANHVPGKRDTVVAVFPEFDRVGRPISDLAHYEKKGVMVRGRVIARRPACDLALIELDSVPAQARAMPLSPGGAREGQAVHVVGNSNADAGALFGCVSGQVRNVFTKEAGPKNPLAGRMVLTSAATNQGDSGGPVVNDAGELVAVVSCGTTGQGNKQVVDYCVDVSEVRALLDVHRPVKPWAKPNATAARNPTADQATSRLMDTALTAWHSPIASPRLTSAASDSKPAPSPVGSVGTPKPGSFGLAPEVNPYEPPLSRSATFGLLFPPLPVQTAPDIRR